MGEADEIPTNVFYFNRYMNQTVHNRQSTLTSMIACFGYICTCVEHTRIRTHQQRLYTGRIQHGFLLRMSMDRVAVCISIIRSRSLSSLFFLIFFFSSRDHELLSLRTPVQTPTHAINHNIPVMVFGKLSQNNHNVDIRTKKNTKKTAHKQWARNKIECLSHCVCVTTARVFAKHVRVCVHM